MLIMFVSWLMLKTVLHFTLQSVLHSKRPAKTQHILHAYVTRSFLGQNQKFHIFSTPSTYIVMATLYSHSKSHLTSYSSSYNYVWSLLSYWLCTCYISVYVFSTVTFHVLYLLYVSSVYKCNILPCYIVYIVFLYNNF